MNLEVFLWVEEWYKKKHTTSTAKRHRVLESTDLRKHRTRSSSTH